MAGEYSTRDNQHKDSERDASSRRSDHGGRPCPLCQTPMFERHCKYVCPNHGVVYDCSDNFWL